MRVAHVIPGYLPAQGGIEALIDDVTPILKSQHHIESTIIVPRFWRERPAEFTNAGTTVLSVDMPQRYSQDSPVTRAARLFKDTRLAIQQSGSDIVHVHGIGHLFAPATNISESLGLPVIHHIHGEVNEHTRSSHLEVLRTSPNVVTVSQPVANSLERFAHRTETMAVIPNGLPAVTSEATEDQHPRIAMIGRLEGPKGFAHGMAAAAELMDPIPQLRVSIVGLGEEMITLQQLAQDLCIADRVTFHGRLTRHQTQGIIARSQVVVVPSLIIEGFSLVAAEAALLERPVVAYRVGGLADTVADGRTGALADAGDVKALTSHIRRYLEDPLLRQRHGQAARARARDLFSVERYAHQLADHYHQILTSEEQQ